MELQTRKPTGRVAWPLVLVEGEEKAGKSYALAALTASERVGRSFLLDLGDGSLDEYGSLGDFDLLVVDGTWASVVGQVEAAAAVPSDPEKPNVIGVDAGTLLWGLLKAKAERRARSSRRARAILAEDPDADIDVTMTYWNDVKDDWAHLLHVLKRFPGIGVISAQGREVSKVDGNGQPVRGQTEWSVDAEKTTTSWVSAWVRMTRDPRQAKLVGVRSLHVAVPTGGLVLPSESTLEVLVFDLLGAGGYGPNTAVLPTLGVQANRAKGRVLAAVKRASPNLSEDEAKAEAARLWAAAGLEGKGEVTEVELAEALPLSTEAPDPPEGDGGGSPSSAPPVTQEPSGGAAATDDAPKPDAATEASRDEESRPVATRSPEGHHVTPQGDVLELGGKPVTTDEAVAYIRGLLKPGAVTLASQLNVPTNGKREDIQERIMEFWGLLGAPFDPAPPATDPPPPADEGAPPVDHEAQDEEGLYQDIPEGWVEEKCICGEPIMYERGNYTATKTHLDQALDVDHAPEEPF